MANSRAALPPNVRYARAFNTLGGENMADPVFDNGPADMFFSAPESDRETVETVIEDVGLRPVYVGETKRPSSIASSAFGSPLPSSRAEVVDLLSVWWKNQIARVFAEGLTLYRRQADLRRAWPAGAMRLECRDA